MTRIHNKYLNLQHGKHRVKTKECRTLVAVFRCCQCNVAFYSHRLNSSSSCRNWCSYIFLISVYTILSILFLASAKAVIFSMALSTIFLADLGILFTMDFFAIYSSTIASCPVKKRDS
jgi:hypothetical protein